MPKNRQMEGGYVSGRKWTDSHCHLDSVDCDPELAVSVAQEAGVAEIVTVGTDVASSRVAVEFARRIPGVWAVAGVHPHEAKHLDDAALEAVADLGKVERVVAIGEIGLDFYREHSARGLQLLAFRRQLELARSLRKPVVLHVRDAYPEVLGMLEQFPHEPGIVFHCFSGGPEEVRRAAAMGGYVSFAGNISFKNAEMLREAARQVPESRLLLETDSPYLAPVPYRGKPNRPALLPAVGLALADALGRPAAQLAEITRENARRIFGLDETP